ncbi:uncharacterized protein LOC126355747 [Schistocerca gregaria]|uniref:uncharacterized protein LOC126355747 n=1 Tax=Schistocerca gregaria TaxID=7010 RepID=UPI00211E8749|nr:uncharacterized protein LOC126355747 [Schistocerca gregaria]
MERFVIDYTIAGPPVCDTASRVTTAMVTELAVHAAGNIELLVQMVVLQTSPSVGSGIETWPHDLLQPFTWMSAKQVLRVQRSSWCNRLTPDGLYWNHKNSTISETGIKYTFWTLP